MRLIPLKGLSISKQPVWDRLLRLWEEEDVDGVCVNNHLDLIYIKCQLMYFSVPIHVPFHALSAVVALSGEGL